MIVGSQIDITQAGQATVEQLQLLLVFMLVTNWISVL